MKQKFVTFTLGLICGVILVFVLRSTSHNSRQDKPPKVDGQAIPQQHFVIDFSKRYDMYLNRFNQTPSIFKNVKFLGYTGDEVRTSDGKMSSYYGGFNRWLVLDLADGRKAYCSGSSIERLEEPKNTELG